MNNLIEEVLKGSAELQKNLKQTETLINSLLWSFKGQGIMNHQSKERGMDSIRDAMIQTGTGRKIVVQVNEEMRTRAIIEETKRENARKERQERFAIRGRYQSLKDLIHYTFVQYPNQNRYVNRFDIYKGSKKLAWEIATEGGEEYDRITRMLQFAPTSKKAFQEAVTLFTDPQHDFNAYDSSDAVIRHG